MKKNEMKRLIVQRRPPRTNGRPKLRFTPTAWAKLLFLRDFGDTEVGGFGISPVDDLLLIEDIQLVRQSCTWAHVEFDDESVADFFDAQVDAGLRPEQFARIWIHTHPGNCPRPSWTDEQTFARVFGAVDWAVMFILARDGDAYARLRFNAGPKAELPIKVDIDYGQFFGACDPVAWEEEYFDNVTEADFPPAVWPDKRGADLKDAVSTRSNRIEEALVAPIWPADELNEIPLEELYELHI